VRINAQLVDATTGHHLWAERFDGQLGDIFALQDRFTRKIVAALALKLTEDEESSLGRKWTDNVEAYEAYLQGLEHLRRMTQEDLAMAVPFFERAIELDPDFGLAYTQFGWGLSGQPYNGLVSRAGLVQRSFPQRQVSQASYGKPHSGNPRDGCPQIYI
jgi:hypothetical protein